MAVRDKQNRMRHTTKSSSVQICCTAIPSWRFYSLVGPLLVSDSPSPLRGGENGFSPPNLQPQESLLGSWAVMAKVADRDMCIPGNALPPLHILGLKTHILLSPLATAAGTSGLETAPVLNEVGCWTARPSHVLQSFHVWLFILLPLCQGPLKGTSTIVFAFPRGELQAHTAMPNVSCGCWMEN